MVDGRLSDVKGGIFRQGGMTCRQAITKVTLRLWNSVVMPLPFVMPSFVELVAFPCIAKLWQEWEMTCLADTLEDMIQESNQNVRRLKDLADYPFLSKSLQCVVIDVMQAETLRLDMLRSIYQELDEHSSKINHLM
jgi:hypothetical protein